MNTDYRQLNVDERVFIQLALERGAQYDQPGVGA
jgi:hypothetical protein